MDKKTKIFLIIAGIVVVVLMAVIPVDIAIKHRRKSAEDAAVRAATLLYQQADAACDTSSFEEGANQYSAALDKLGPFERQADLTAKIRSKLRAISSKAEKQRVTRLAKEEEERQQRLAREQTDRVVREVLALEEAGRQRKVQEAALARQKAREMYPNYKQAAENLADNVLRLISATETGISYQKHSEMLQDLQFSFNKFAMRCTDPEKEYSSYLHLAEAVGQFKVAQTAWKHKIDDGSNKTWDDLLQEAWQKAGDEYRSAMGSMAKVE